MSSIFVITHTDIYIQSKGEHLGLLHVFMNGARVNLEDSTHHGDVLDTEFKALHLHIMGSLKG